MSMEATQLCQSDVGGKKDQACFISMPTSLVPPRDERAEQSGRGFLHTAYWKQKFSANLSAHVYGSVEKQLSAECSAIEGGTGTATGLSREAKYLDGP